MFLRFLLAFGVLIALFYIVGVGELVAVFQQIQLVYIVYLLVLAVVMIWASCLKWRLFVRASGHEVSILRLMKLYTVGYFFNTFAPSYIGQDVSRSFYLGRYVESQKDAFIATILERFTGLLAMSLLGLTFVMIGTKATAGVEAAIITVAFLCVLLAFIFFSNSCAKFFFKSADWFLKTFLKGQLRERLTLYLDKVQPALDKARGDSRLFFKAMLLSLFYHSLTVVNTYIAARAIGWDSPDIGGLFVAVPLVLLVSMIPVTPSGLGIQEGAFLFFLERIGGSREQGLSVGLVLRAKAMIIAAVGGLLFLTLKKEERNK